MTNYSAHTDIGYTQNSGWQNCTEYRIYIIKTPNTIDPGRCPNPPPPHPYATTPPLPGIKGI